MGQLNLVSGDVLTGKEYEGGQIANCWVEASKDGKILYAVQMHFSSSISTYSIGDDGQIKLTNEKEFKNPTEEDFFSDLYLNSDGSMLYQLIGNKGQIKAFNVSDAGNLSAAGTYGRYAGCRMLWARESVRVCVRVNWTILVIIIILSGLFAYT